MIKGGYLIIIVPHEDLYEQHNWPSLWNSEHKHTFRLGNNTSWSPVSFDIISLVNELNGFKIVSAKIQDNNYNYKFIKERNSKEMYLIYGQEFFTVLLGYVVKEKLENFF